MVAREEFLDRQGNLTVKRGDEVDVLIKSLEQMTLPIGVVALQGVFGGASLSVLMAATVMAVLPLFVVFLVAQRFIIEGLTMTGIKG